MSTFWIFFLKNKNFSFIIITALVLFGLLSVSSINKESSPEVQVPVAIVTTVLPGASAFDVERLLTNEIEDQLDGSLDEVSSIISTSREGVSSVVVEFDARADLDKSIQSVRDEVDKVKSELPRDAEDPVVSEVNFVDQPIMNISIISDESVTQLIELVDDISDEIEGVKGVSRVQVSGIPEREVQVIVRKESLAQFGISITDVVSALSRANTSLPAGSLEIEGVDYAVRFDGTIEEASEINDIAILSRSGQPIYVRDVAFVSDGVSDTSRLSRVSINGEPSQQAATLFVYKQQGSDVGDITSSVRERLGELESTLLRDTEYLISFDTGEFINDDLRTLSFTAFQAILLVMIVLLVALGWREALIAGLSIPLSFLIAFIGLYYSGNTINFISLFSLILAVGILVDSAIVVTEAIHTKMKEGGEKIDAAINTIKEFHFPITSGTATTIAVFAPLFLISGVTGQFIASIPFTIIFVLIASLFVALGIVPLIASMVLKRRSRTQFEQKQEVYTHKLIEWYKNFLRNFVGNRKKEKRFIRIMMIGFFVALALPFTGLLSVIFFPQEDIDFIYVEVEKPEGTILSFTDLSVREVEDVLYTHPEIESFVTEVGSGSAFNEGTQAEKTANITLLLDKNRKKTSTEIIEELRDDVSTITSAKVRVLQPNNGPPTGAPVLIQIFGEDIDELKQVIEDAEGVLESIPGATEITTSSQSDALQFSMRIDRAKASQVGADPQMIAQILRTSVVGTDVITIKNVNQDTDVVVKLNINESYINPHDTNRASIDSLKNISIQTSSGSILLGSLVDIELESSSAIIRHDDRKRLGFVSSQVSADSTVREVIGAFQKEWETYEMPKDVSISFGGETEDVNQSFKEMGLSLIVGLVGIIAVLVLQFNSFRQAFYIVAIVPLSLIGVFFGLAIFGRALSFSSIMGFIALTGIVVNNSIILIDHMNALRKKESLRPIDEIVIEAAGARLRPILLTTLTTVMGAIPLTYASDLWSPLAFALMFGLLFAVVITLILVPVLYSRWPGKLPE